MTALLFLLRLFLAIRTDLAPDEAYYWEFATNPDFSYYDHPPMVGWIIAVFRMFPINPQLQVRLPSIVGLTLASWFIFDIGSKWLKSDQIGFLGAFILNMTPSGTALGFITTPDTPLAFAWAFTTWTFLKAIANGKFIWWCFTGLGLAAGALSKYNMILFVPAIALTILCFKDNRRYLKTSGFWLMVLIAALGTAPIIYWNINHDWISFRFQFDHGFGGSSRSTLSTFGEFIGGQLGTIGITLLPLMLYLSFKSSYESYKKVDPSIFFMAMLVVPSTLLFAYSSLSSRVQANWPQVAYTTGFLITAKWLTTKNSSKHFFAVLAPTLLVTFIALFHTITFSLPIPQRTDTIARLYGWRQMGKIIQSANQESNNKSSFVVQGSALASLVAFYGKVDSQRIFEPSGAGNYRIWQKGRKIPTGSDIIYVDIDRISNMQWYKDRFDTIKSRSHEIEINNKIIRNINITKMYNLKKPIVFTK